MNLVQLRYFVAVARSKNLTRAATELRVAQPAITRQLKLLEADLGTVLFRRHAKGVDLTDAGRILLEKAEFQIRSFDQLQDEFRDLTFAPSGHLRIGCPPALINRTLGPAVHAFLQKWPNIRIEVREDISDQLTRAVLNDGLDVAIASTDMPQPHLECAALFGEQVWVFGPSSAKLPRTVSLKQLSKLSLLIPRRDNAIRELIERETRAAGLHLRILVESDSVTVNEDLVKKGAGHVVAPYFSLADRYKTGQLSGAPISNCTINRSLISRKDRPVTRVMQEFLKVLRPEIERVRKEARIHGRR
jgi:LysR family transcriptional regulator, nitrogen assimilation regulatory protein